MAVNFGRVKVKVGRFYDWKKRKGVHEGEVFRISSKTG